jgi:flagellar protein FlaG
MANEIAGLKPVIAAMQVESGRQRNDRPELPGKGQPVQRQNLPHGTNDTATKPVQNETTSASGDLSEAVNRINDIIQNTQRDLLFSIDEGSGRSTITVMDSQTKEVIRQIPSEDVLRMVEHLKASTSGMLFSSDV